MAKMTRERAVKERRAQKQEKKRAAAAARIANAGDTTLSLPMINGETYIAAESMTSASRRPADPRSP